MKARARHRLLLAIFCIAAPMSLYTWRVVSDEHPNNPVGVLLGVLGLLVVCIVYASSGVTFGIEWLIAKLRSSSATNRADGTFDKIRS